jgi:CDGSH iron-sulfur domain-containing protein 3
MAETLPTMMELEPGTYYWCSCGKSAKLPFCDGSHAGTGKTPLEFTLEQKQKVTPCTCQRTKMPPWCDGSHQK